MSSFFKRLVNNLKSDPAELESQDDFDIENQEELEDTLGGYQEETDGELAVDVYDDGDMIIVKTMTAGVRKEDLEITISREEVTIRGSRYDEQSPSDQHYVYQELYWGTFTRTLTLPEEVDIDHAEATEEHGLLTLSLPKVDKFRQAHLSVS